MEAPYVKHNPDLNYIVIVPSRPGKLPLVTCKKNQISYNSSETIF